MDKVVDSNSKVAQVAQAWNLTPQQVEAVITAHDSGLLKLMQNMSERQTGPAWGILERHTAPHDLYRAQGVIQGFRRFYLEVDNILEEFRDE